MQTFLPYPDFKQSAAVLDRQRLCKQRVEAYQILRCLTGEGSLRWAAHPAVKMWKGHEVYLAGYAIVMCREWKRRGYQDTIEEKVTNLINRYPWHLYAVKKPSWLGNRAFHRSHQSNLLRKARNYYRTHFKRVPSNLEYVWPVQTTTSSGGAQREKSATTR